MKKTTLTKLLVFLFFSMVGYFYAPHIRPIIAQASSTGPIGCGLLAPSIQPNDCLLGQYYTTCTVVDPNLGTYKFYGSSTTYCDNGQTSDQLKSDLINNMALYSQSSQPAQYKSAEYINKLYNQNMTKGQTWQQAIMQTGYVLEIQPYSFSLNTMFVPNSSNGGSVVQYTEPATDTQDSLVIYYRMKGVLVEQDAIKLDCGNPVGPLTPIKPIPVISIQGVVYHTDKTTNTPQYIAYVPIIFSSCNTGSTNTYTYSSGKFSNTSLKPGESFCVSVPSTYTTQGTTYSNPAITPGYILGVTNPPPGAVGSCNGNGFTQYYQAQIASTPSSPGTCNYGITNSDYNISYKTSSVVVPICIPIAANNYCKNPTPVTPCVLPSSGTDYQNITLPSTIPSFYTIVSSFITPGISTSNAPIYEAIPGNYRIDTAYDQYSPPTYIISSPTAYQASPNFQLNYYQYLYQYPYDDHTTYVNYDQQAIIGTFTPSLAYYECGGVYNGTNPTCTSSITSSSTTTCISFKLGSTCCPAGTTSTIGLNFATDFVTASYVAVFSGGGGGGTTGTKYTCKTTTTTTSRYPGTAYYRFSLSSSQADYPRQMNGPGLNEFCPRNFTVLPPTNTDVNSVILSGGNNTPDQPNQATVSTQTTVQFSLNYWTQRTRKPLYVNGINYVGNYYIEHANNSGRVPIDSPDQQTFNIGNSNPPDQGQPLFAPGNITHPYSITFPVSLPPLEVGDKICAQFSDTPQSGEVNNAGLITNVDSNGPVDSTQIPKDPTCSGPVANYPYSRAYGNDIIAGIDFSNSIHTQCDSSASVIASINPDSVAVPRGSGAQFATLAIGQIAYYASAFLRGAILVPTANNGLTQANTVLPPPNTAGVYGGNYDTGCQPIYNYYLNRPQIPSSSVTVTNGQTYGVDDTTTPPNLSTVQLSFTNPANNNYIILQAHSGNNDPHITGEHVIYINGNVYIPNDITYNASGDSYDASAGTVSTVPNLYLIASGNIYIGPNVKQLDGIFVAQNQCDWSLANSNCDPSSGSGGIINTCSDPSGVGIVSGSNESDAFPPSTLFTNCEQQLTVTGALIGHEVKLERTYASMRNSVGGENPIGGGNHSCKDGNGSISPATAQDCSAEIFNFNPTNYLGKPDFSANGYNFDSIISLPPVL